MSNLIFYGFKGSGKSYFAELLAKELQRHFIDTDQWIENLYKEEYGEVLSCRQIVHKHGRESFLRLESRVVEQLDMTDAVIALGGGTILNRENCIRLQQIGLLVYLEAEKEVIRKRIFSQGIPSFLDAKDPEGSFERMYAERKPIYESVSAFRVVLEGKTDRQVLDELVALTLLTQF